MQLFNARVVYVSFAGNKNIQERVICIFQQDGIIGGVKACGQSVVAVDNSNGQVRQAVGDNCCVQFTDNQVFRVSSDVFNIGNNIIFVFNFNQAFICQKEQGTTAIGRVVRNTNDCAFGNLFTFFNFLGIYCHGEVYGFENFNQFKGRLFFQSCFQVGSVLHGVCKEFALVESNVRSYIIGEFYNFNFQAFLFCQFFYIIHNFSVRTCGYANFNGSRGVCFLFFFLIAATTCCESGKCAKCCDA